MDHAPSDHECRYCSDRDAKHTGSATGIPTEGRRQLMYGHRLFTQSRPRPIRHEMRSHREERTLKGEKYAAL